MKKKKGGFTLIELLVVVIIIGILAAIAVPQYKHAALKSRFSTVMPMAKAIADAQEVYYQGRQMYALSQDELDVTPVNAENTSVSLSTQAEEDKYAYVAAQRSDVPGARYIVYQKYSPMFASTIQCEADENNADALWLCEKGLGGRPVSNGSLQGDGWKAYLLVGEQGNSKFTACSGPKPAPRTASNSQAVGTPVCDEETGEYTYAWSGGKEYGLNEYCQYGCQGGIFSGQQSYCQANSKNGCEGSIISGERARCTANVAEGCTGIILQGGQGSHCEDNTQTGGMGCKGVTIPAGSYCLAYGFGWSLDNPGCVGAIYEYDPNDSTKRGCCASLRNWHCPVGSPKCNDDGTKAWSGKCWGEGNTTVDCED